MMKEIALSNTTKFIVDNRGKTAPTEKTGIPLIATNCIDNNNLYPVYDKLRYVSQHTYENWFRSHPEPDDIILTLKGSQNGAVCLVPEIVDFVIAQDMVALRANEEVIDPKYLFAALRSPYVQHQIKSLDVSGVIPHLKKSDFDKLMIPYPSIESQTKIGELYYNLSKQIDLLHRQNQTLEQLAETLFRQWFDEMDYNSSISDLIEIQNGYAFKSKDFIEAGNHRVIKIKNISSNSVDISTSDFVSVEVVRNMNNKFKIRSGDILFAMTGAEIGKMGIVEETEENLWLNQRVGLFVEKIKGSKYLAYLCLNSDYGKDYITNTATGSAQPNISAMGIINCPFPNISESEIIEKSNILDGLYSKVIFNLGQVKNLENLRDTLLPKLMSGEVRVEME